METTCNYLPYPPTVNHYWVYARRAIHLTPTGRIYRRRFAWAWASNRVERDATLDNDPASLRYALAITVHPPDRRKRDLDNVLKAILDALTFSGAIHDDEQIDDLHVLRGDRACEGCIDVVLTSLKRADRRSPKRRR